jgi:hypothetical protein
MPMLTREEYQELSRQLNTYEDIKRLQQERGLDREILLVIYTHRVTRDATKRYYTVLNHVNEMVREWNQGKSYVDIAKKWRFPPVLIAQMIEKHKKTSRRSFWDGFRRPEEISDPRIRSEVKDAMAADWIYSPRGGEIQRERGVHGETRLHDWLDKFKIPYRTESDLRGRFSKTPDALLGRAIGINGQRVQWIESKANFGDDVEVGRNVRKQLVPYVKLFGEGIVVYWYGFVSSIEGPPGIMILDGDTFESLVPADPPPEREIEFAIEPKPQERPRPVESSRPVERPRETERPRGSVKPRRQQRPVQRRSESAPPRPQRRRRTTVDRSAYF